MSRYGSQFLAGLVFAIGLALSGMTNPNKVIGFLDVFGSWDPSLALVMSGAVGVYFAVYRASRRLRKPLAASAFSSAPPAPVDVRLIVGSLLFGVGWGLGGYCPGPAVVSAARGTLQVLLFCAAMLLGLVVTRYVTSKRAAAG